MSDILELSEDLGHRAGYLLHVIAPDYIDSGQYNPAQARQALGEVKMARRNLEDLDRLLTAQLVAAG